MGQGATSFEGDDCNQCGAGSISTVAGVSAVVDELPGTAAGNQLSPAGINDVHGHSGRVIRR